ncbi:hypothetical protein FRZ67_06650 [Panacibacter ginsenosidivorans]|uniref:Chemotaxis methyl-accepting receptor HlyB-like 4HB MCP domain-containing protein n=1 Tax=Panacibacter ginsenosidivorans TaxID=1813871 RepID=A0A5B8V6Y3_9BACT|nr:hypothetical protein [Panacibacter ginsenosidivorans]QEC66989.1 hypothetical protein FRZ67_06650 [Panacibacter ginsenosidivorans]
MVNGGVVDDRLIFRNKKTIILRVIALINMGQKMTRFEKINVFNIILTLLLSAIAVMLSYNSYRISENTFTLSEKVDRLNMAQSEIELKSSVFALFTTIDMLRQNDAEGKNLDKCIKSLTEMKTILESQMKNIYLAQNSDLSELWVELYSKTNFDIKFLEEGLKANTIVSGVKDIIIELESQAKVIFDTFLDHSKKSD